MADVAESGLALAQCEVSIAHVYGWVQEGRLLYSHFLVVLIWK